MKYDKWKMENDSQRTPRYSVTGEGPLLVFISGLDGTGELFFKQAPALSLSHRVVTFRQRETGQFTYEDLADDVAAIVKHTGERQATIVAESFGGGVALTFALRYPQMVERLVIVNSFPRYRERIRINLAARLTPLFPFQLIWPVRLAANRLGLFIDGVTGEDRLRFFAAARTINPEGYARRLKLIAELDLDDRLSEIHAPTLIVAADLDLLVRSIREADFMRSRMPNASVKVIKGVGHACLLGDRVRLAELIAQ
jgi:pimeloyl-ACP methyl ester carboxylesterase